MSSITLTINDNHQEELEKLYCEGKYNNLSSFPVINIACVIAEKHGVRHLIKDIWHKDVVEESELEQFNEHQNRNGMFYHFLLMHLILCIIFREWIERK